jgi:hypothetical protein
MLLVVRWAEKPRLSCFVCELLLRHQNKNATCIMPLARAGAIVDGILLLQYQNKNATTLDIFFLLTLGELSSGLPTLGVFHIM